MVNPQTYVGLHDNFLCAFVSRRRRTAEPDEHVCWFGTAQSLIANVHLFEAYDYEEVSSSDVEKSNSS